MTQPSLASAQDTGRFRGMDSNRDGVITRSEWRGTDQSFRVHDWNRDGVLSGNEIQSGRWSDGRWEDQDYDPQTSRIDWTPAMFTRLDRNRDGRIVAAEWPYANETFYRIDRDNNNWISRAEFLGTGDANYDDDRVDQFDYLDADNDGRIEWNEWHGTRVAFNRLDRNNDGYISRSEMLGTTTETRNDQFASLDFNRNGVLSPDEWNWSRRSFNARDLNRDSVLSRREFEAAGDPTTANDATRASNRTREIVVNSRERWTDTGMYVNAGEVIDLAAFGQIRMSGDQNDIATPAGSNSGRRAANAPMPNSPAGALIARIGNSNVYVVGQIGTFRAPASGQLYLGVNDDHLPDNSGSFRVRLTPQ